LAASAPVAPAAAAGWSAPVTVSAGRTLISAPQLMSGPAGERLAWTYWDQRPGTTTSFGPLRAADAIAPPNGAFGAERRLPSSYATGQLVNLGRGKVAQLILTPERGNVSGLQVALGDVTGAFARPLTIPAAVFGARASLAGNARGDLIVAWLSSPRTAHRQVWASVRPAGGRFGTPQLLSPRADGLSVAAAAGRRGDLVVAYTTKRGRLLTRVRVGRRGACRPSNPVGCSIAGRRWGGTQNIGPAAVATDNRLAPSVGQDGSVTVAWFFQQLSEGGLVGPSHTQVAVQPAGARRFLPVQSLAREPFNEYGASAPVVATETGDRRVVAFIANAAANDTTAVVKVAYSHGNRFGKPQTISRAGQWASGVAAAEGPRGPIVTWASNTAGIGASSAATVYAAVNNPSRHRLGLPQPVASSEHVDNVNATAPTYSANSDRWLVAWVGHPQYQWWQVPGPAFMRVAACGGACR
jgi:hypothetical protein